MNLKLDCFDDLVVGGEDDGDGEQEAEGVDVGDVGEVPGQAHVTGGLPGHTAADKVTVRGTELGLMTPSSDMFKDLSLPVYLFS